MFEMVGKAVLHTGVQRSCLLCSESEAVPWGHPWQIFSHKRRTIKKTHLWLLRDHRTQRILGLSVNPVLR